MTTATATPELKTWLNLFDILESTPGAADPANLTQHFSAMCTQQGLSASPAQVRATIEHYLGQQAAPALVDTPSEPRRAPPPEASQTFRLWSRPAVEATRKKMLEQLDQWHQAYRAGKERRNVWGWRTWGGFAVLNLVGWVIWGIQDRHVHHLSFSVLDVMMLCVPAFLTGSLTWAILCWPGCLYENQRWTKRLKKRHHAAQEVAANWATKKWGAGTALETYTPATQDMRAWMECPTALAALQLLEQEAVPLLYGDREHLDNLVAQWEEGIKDQEVNRERAAMAAAWKELVGTKLLALSGPDAPR
jgi:hypothetical protein